MRICFFHRSKAALGRGKSRNERQFLREGGKTLHSSTRCAPLLSEAIAEATESTHTSSNTGDATFLIPSQAQQNITASRATIASLGSVLCPVREEAESMREEVDA